MNPKTIPKSFRNVNLCAFRLLALGRNLFVPACWLLWIDQSLPEFHGYLRMSGSVPDFWWGFWGWFVGMAWLQKHSVSLSSARLIVVFLWMCWSWSKSLFCLLNFVSNAVTNVLKSWYLDVHQVLTVMSTSSNTWQETNHQSSSSFAGNTLYLFFQQWVEVLWLCCCKVFA